MRPLLLAAALGILAGCGSVPNSVTATPERKLKPLPESTPVAIWLAPAHSPETIESLVRQYGEVEILSRPHGSRVGEVVVVHGNRITRLEQAMAEARKMGGNALYFAQGAASGENDSASVHRAVPSAW